MSELTCQRWLNESKAKQALFLALYGDLLASHGRRVLDIGGGVVDATTELMKRHDYTLVDLLAHGGGDGLPICVMDWYDFQPIGRYDVVIANDLFPNVDQRLALFLDKFMPLADELRLTLTWYNQPRFYRTQRLDGDEQLCLLAWDGDQVWRVMERYVRRIRSVVKPLDTYANGRSVVLVTLQ